MIILKRRNSTNSWQVYHANANASPATGGLFLNTTDAFTALSTTWNDTVPTSTVFSLGTDTFANGSGATYVAYCFSEIAGYSRFGSYVGNGSSDGPFVYTGFRPKWIMFKATSTTSGWSIGDTIRSPNNVVDKALYPHLSNAEEVYTWFDTTSNGFKLRSSLGGSNSNGVTYMYMAFAESPFALNNRAR
jgi:hypothetical protein